MNTAKAYDKLVEKYAAVYGQNTEYNYFLDQLMAIVHKGKILDLGCGTGEPVAKSLVQHGYEVVGVDFSKKMISAAVNNVPKATFLFEDMEKLELEPGSFDAICAFFSLTHLRKKEIPRFMKKLFEALKERGAILIGVTDGDFEGNGEILGEEVYISEFTEDELKILLDDFQIELIEKREFQPQSEEPETQIYALATKPSLTDEPEEDIQAVLAKSPEEELEVTKTIDAVEEQDIDSMIDKLANQIEKQENQEAAPVADAEQKEEDYEQEIDSIAKESEMPPENPAAAAVADEQELDLDKELATPSEEHTDSKVEESGKWREKIVTLQPEPARVVKGKHAAESASVVIPVNYEEPKKSAAEKPEHKEFKDLLDKLIAAPPKDKVKIHEKAKEPEEKKDAQDDEDDEQTEEERRAERYRKREKEEIGIIIRKIRKKDEEDDDVDESDDEDGDERKEDADDEKEDKHHHKRDDDDEGNKPLLRIRF